MVPAEDGDKHHDWYSGELPTCVFWTNSPSLLVNRYTLKSTSTSKSTIWSRRYYVHHIFYCDHIRNYDVLIAGRLCLDINGCSILYKRWAVAWKIFLTLQLTSGHCFPGKQAKAGKEQVESRKPFENVSDSPPSPKIRTSSCWNWAPDISTAGLLIVRRWVKEGEIDTINHQQTWQWGFTVHPVNKSPVSRVSLTNVYIPLLPRYST